MKVNSICKERVQLKMRDFVSVINITSQTEAFAKLPIQYIPKVKVSFVINQQNFY